MKKPLFTGSGVAIVTPFTKETVDLPTLGKLLDFQMKNGTDAKLSAIWFETDGLVWVSCCFSGFSLFPERQLSF